MSGWFVAAVCLLAVTVGLCPIVGVLLALGWAAYLWRQGAFTDPAKEFEESFDNTEDMV